MEGQPKLRALVVGAGPCGSLMSVMLANRGYCVDLVEKNPDIYGLSGTFTYVMLLSQRSLKAIRHAGIELPPSVALDIEGSQIYRSGKSMYFKFEHECANVGRNELNQFLVEQARNHDSKNITVHLGWTLYALEEEGAVARFRRTGDLKPDPILSNFPDFEKLEYSDEDRKDFKQYDLLVGADGVRSVMREELLRIENEKCEGHFSKLTVNAIPNTRKFKQLPTLPPTAGDHPLLKQNPRAIKIFVGKVPGFSVIVGPVSGGRYLSVILISGDKASDRVKHPEDIRLLFETAFPELLDIFEKNVPDFINIVAKQPLGNGGMCIWCSQFNSGKIVLLGDAAHSMFPSLGQGCNAALEDCFFLDQVLHEHEGGGADAIPAALKTYSDRRKVDAHAIVQMSYSPPVPGAGTMWNSLKAIGRLSILTAAKKVVPSLKGPMWRLPLHDDDIPYSKIKAMVEEEERTALVIATCSVTTFIAVGALVYFGVSKWNKSS